MNRMSSYAIQNRKFIMHSAHPTIGVSVALAARRFEYAVLRPRKVFAIAGPQDRHLAELVQNYLLDFLGDDYPHEWNWVSIKAKGTPLGDITAHDIDCLILFGRPEALSAQDLEQIHDYWQCGGSLAAFRIADFAMRGNARFADEIFGGEYYYEHLLQPAKISLLHQAGRHPLLRGVQPFVSRGGLHRYDLPLTQATPILFGSVSGETLPVAWVRSRLGRRVFATTLGSPADFRHTCFLRLLANAIVWTAR
jgi:Trehalose utilisation